MRRLPRSSPPLKSGRKRERKMRNCSIAHSKHPIKHLGNAPLGSDTPPRKRNSCSKHPIEHFGNVPLVAAAVIVVNHQGIEVLVPAKFLHFLHAAIRCIEHCGDAAEISSSIA